ncbi:hypothetical protein [Endozoicomonas ascidiicola]|uniref:hypothetical protein n=1 Tax=Endozoicomonas ascidiicola TaxID=1698521 RepID=UPI000830CDE5|nr:hypothetical protein [Endozoicomonas ascidiicola]
MDNEQDVEKNLEEQIEAGKRAIEEAQHLIQSMDTLKKKLHISHGSGQRFLQRAKPSMALLKEAEQLINTEFSGSSEASENAKAKGKNKSKLLNNIARQNKA